MLKPETQLLSRCFRHAIYCWSCICKKTPVSVPRWTPKGHWGYPLDRKFDRGTVDEIWIERNISLIKMKSLGQVQNNRGSYSVQI